MLVMYITHVSLSGEYGIVSTRRAEPLCPPLRQTPDPQTQTTTTPQTHIPNLSPYDDVYDSVKVQIDEANCARAHDQTGSL